MFDEILETPETRRVWKGIFSAALGYVIKSGESVILVPFFLGAWGSDLYGRWLILTASLSYLALLDLGGQNYFANLLAIRNASGDEEGFKKDLSEGVSVFLLIGFLGFLFLSLALILFQIVPAPALSRLLEPWEAWVMGFVGSNFLLGVSAGVYLTCYRSAGFYARGVMVSNWIQGGWFLVSAGLLYGSGSPIVYAASILAGGLISVTVFVWDTRRNIPGCKGLSINFTSARRGCSHLSGALFFWLMALAHFVKLQGVVLVLAFVASPVGVAIFVTHRALANIAGHTNMLVQGPVIPELSFLWAQQRHGDLQRATFASVKLLMVAVGSVALLLWLSAPLAYPLWTGGKLSLEPGLLLILLVQGVLAAGWSTSAWALLATNHHRALTGWFLGNAAVTLALAAWLGSAHGAIGVAIAGVIGDLFCGLLVYPVLASSFLKLPPARLYRELGAGALVLLPLAGAAYLARVLLNGWWGIAFFVLAGAGLAYPMLRKEPGVAGAVRDFRHLAADWVRKAR